MTTNDDIISDERIKEIAESLKPVELIATIGTPLKAGDKKASKEEAIEVIKQIYDPEIPINIYDLGLIYKVDCQGNGNLYIEMTLTTPTCPIAGEMPRIVATSLAMQDNVGEVTVKIVWDPPWNLTMISEDGKMILEMM